MAIPTRNHQEQVLYEKLTYLLVPQSAMDPYNHHSERSVGNSAGRKAKGTGLFLNRDQ